MGSVSLIPAEARNRMDHPEGTPNQPKPGEKLPPRVSGPTHASDTSEDTTMEIDSETRKSRSLLPSGAVQGFEFRVSPTPYHIYWPVAPTPSRNPWAGANTLTGLPCAFPPSARKSLWWKPNRGVGLWDLNSPTWPTMQRPSMSWETKVS